MWWPWLSEIVYVDCKYLDIYMYNGPGPNFYLSLVRHVQVDSPSQLAMNNLGRDST